MNIPRPIQKLMEAFERLPGIGPKTAARLTFYLLHVPQEELDLFSKALGDLKRKTVLCSYCFNVSETDPCPICSDKSRDKDIICVVESPLDVLALERAGFRGLYHVLHGIIDPLNNIGPEEIRIKELIYRLAPSAPATLTQGPPAPRKLGAVPPELARFALRSKAGGRSLTQDASLAPEVKEIILATNPTMEGEATAMYIKKRIEEMKRIKRIERIKITRIGRGLPVGGDLEYADDVTLGKALEGRSEY